MRRRLECMIAHRNELEVAYNEPLSTHWKRSTFKADFRPHLPVVLSASDHRKGRQGASSRYGDIPFKAAKVVKVGCMMILFDAHPRHADGAKLPPSTSSSVTSSRRRP
jgi:hypothetical protein